MKTPPPPLAPQWAGHMTGFLERLKVLRQSPATISSREQSLKLFFRFLDQAEPGPIIDVREISKQTVRDFIAWMQARYAPYSVHVHMIALRRFFEHLEATDVLLVNPCAGIQLPKLEDRLPRNVFTHEEVRRILDAPDTQTQKGIRDKAILEMFYSTGMRREEMARLTIHDVDHSKGFVRVNKGKGGKDRVLPLGTKACDCVREYLQRVRAEWIKDNRDERALWLGQYWPHQPIKKQLIAVMVSQYAKSVGIEKQASPHIWRHTCATHMVSNGANVAYAQRLLGHVCLSTTQRYMRVSIPEIKAMHAETHPRNDEPNAKELKTVNAPLQQPPQKVRPAYRYKKGQP
jgi:integrase/recombinase XerD